MYSPLIHKRSPQPVLGPGQLRGFAHRFRNPADVTSLFHFPSNFPVISHDTCFKSLGKKTDFGPITEDLWALRSAPEERAAHTLQDPVPRVRGNRWKQKPRRTVPKDEQNDET